MLVSYSFSHLDSNDIFITRITFQILNDSKIIRDNIYWKTNGTTNFHVDRVSKQNVIHFAIVYTKYKFKKSWMKHDLCRKVGGILMITLYY